jgi:hypothetical protein
VHRDNFRHLTGLGREYAAFVEHILSNWDVEADKALPTGNLIVRKTADGTEFTGRFIPHDDSAVDHVEDLGGGQKATPQLTLSLIVERDGLCEITALPLLMLLDGFPNCAGYHQVYQHEYLSDESNESLTNAAYIGVTKRGWRTRWAEHVRAAESGSQYRFHRAIRQWQGRARVTMHTVIACGLSERAAMQVEESLVERETLYPRGLNMVPGGNAGLAYLRRIGALGQRERTTPDDIQSVVNRFFDHASRKGLPNPLAAANWLNPEYAEKVICAGPDRLKPKQIRDARYLGSLGRDVAEIASIVGARNIAQIQRMLSGETYSRVS